VVTPVGGGGDIEINQEAWVYVSEMEPRKMVTLDSDGKQLYVACLEGAISANGMGAKTRDALKIKKEAVLTIESQKNSHFLIVSQPDGVA
jgi:redox-sensitive bicupin YhaK (pirin superfamily)